MSNEHASSLVASTAIAQGAGPAPGRKPNIVFILADNFGWGDFGAYGGQVATPRIDGLATDGMRFTNYSVECQCTPSRSAILSGRYPVRTGNMRVPFPGEGQMGLAPWEYTLPKLLSDAGYATALYGKWHVGNTPGRMPSDQGFDEWWGILNSSDEAAYAESPLFRSLGYPAPHIWEGQRGSASRPVEPFTLELKAHMDERIVGHGTDFIRRQAADGSKPFFLYLGMTLVHPPVTVHPAFLRGSPDRQGIYADCIAEIDFRVGQVLDAIREAGIENDTIVVFSSDNTADAPAGGGGGSNGPWRGNFFTPPFEGSYRTAAMIRWPGSIPRGVVSNEMLTSVDWMPTLAGLAGESGRMPTDRPIDGIDASEFMLGQRPTSGRESLMYFGPDGELMSVKWRNLKAVFRYAEGITRPVVTPYFPILYDLSSDPGEQVNLFETNMGMAWVIAPIEGVVSEYRRSLERYPNIPLGADFEGYQ
ncbi:arylsulfatase [Kaistia hirudinis]|uniref:Arylsulfatase n=1 Tax=Kaistia hirudinis TaxID=1293440 RepID=A0A840AVK1_9HYPH|nr:arylsulfatase [Kaistia hirudinis]MBB3933712.1 arylsulfatase [Kaistia hirudinis]